MPFEAGHRFEWSWGRCVAKNSVSEPISGPNFRPNFLQCRRKTHWAAPRFPERLPGAFWKAPKASLTFLQGLFGLTSSIRENLGEHWANFFQNPWPDQKWQARLEPLTAQRTLPAEILNPQGVKNPIFRISRWAVSWPRLASSRRPAPDTLIESFRR